MPISIWTVSGTLRSNLDPFNLHTDATLWDALKRSHLVESSKPDSLTTTSETETTSGAHPAVDRFTLDTVIEDEGSNLSFGQVSSLSPVCFYNYRRGLIHLIFQRSLVSLARALVKNAKVIILDEATGIEISDLVSNAKIPGRCFLSASVDYETDQKIQDTIACEFKDRTVLCIARQHFTIPSSLSTSGRP